MNPARIEKALNDRPDQEPVVPAIPRISRADADDLGQVVSLAEERHRRFGKTIEQLEGALQLRSQQALDRLDGVRSLDASAKSRVAGEEAVAAHRELTEGSEEQRWALIREMEGLARRAQAVEILWASPMVALTRQGIGTPERSACEQQMSSLGPAALRSLAALAVATGNLVMAAALQSVNDSRPRRERAFDSAELAEATIGERTRAMQNAALVVRNRMNEVMTMNRQWTSGRRGGIDKIRSALARRREAPVRDGDE